MSNLPAAAVAHFQVSWSDLDANRHMGNSAYLDYASQSRFLYLSSAGFGPSEFQKTGVGPAIFEDRIQYRKELHFLQRFRVELWLSGQSDDGRHYAFESRFLREDDTLIALVNTRASWFDLNTRKVCAPPDALKAAMDALPRTEGFQVL